MEKKKCVTHPGSNPRGGAHRDDFVACCLAFVLDGIDEIVRREPTPEELADKDVLVLDTGLKYEPGLNNFDHHQDKDEFRQECALSLYARHRVYRGRHYRGKRTGENVHALLNHTKWFGTTILMDVQGPFAAARELGISVDALFRTFSPVEDAILGLFAGATRVDRESHLGTLMWWVGEAILEEAWGLAESLKDLNDEIRIIHASGVPGFFLDRENSTGTREWRERYGEGTAFSIMPSDREGEGFALYRFDDDPRINFALIGEESDVVFAHPGGFIAKTTSDVTLDRAIELVAKAVVASDS